MLMGVASLLLLGSLAPVHSSDMGTGFSPIAQVKVQELQGAIRDTSATLQDVEAQLEKAKADLLEHEADYLLRQIAAEHVDEVARKQVTEVRLRGGHEHSDEAEVQLEVPRPAHAMLRETGSGVRGDSGAPAAGASRLTPEVEDSEENVALEVEEESVQDGRAEEMVRGGSVADACVQEEEFAEEKEELERTRIEVEELKARILKNPKSRKRKNKTKHA
eukprot:Tamp_20881.p1 GENE.Tamp_20881~~Tamp_20881.p1  ORF type:complete len:245 (-),score=72.71 Tamp_20881:441-1097(-)